MSISKSISIICFCAGLLLACSKKEDLMLCRQVPIKETGTGLLSSWVEYEYDENNRLLRTKSDGDGKVLHSNILRISYNSAGEVEKVVHNGISMNIPLAIGYFRDSSVYEFSRKDKIITYDVTEFWEKEIFDQYTETITLNNLDLPSKIEKRDGSYYSYLYDAKGNLISAKYTHVDGPQLDIENTFTSDNKNGMFSHVNTSKWCLIFMGYIDIYNNMFPKQNNIDQIGKFTYIYDSCGYIKAIQSPIGQTNIEYKYSE